MIIGIGSDICAISRIREVLDRHDQRFIDRVFTNAEQEKAAAQDDPAATYAKRWAAKEACSKALGSGIANDVYLKDIGVVNGEGGVPTLALTGGAAEMLSRIMPDGRMVKLHLSLSDDGDYAQAFVIIEAV